MSSDLSSLLLASLHPASRKQAEQSLTALSVQPGFIGALLQLVLGEGTQDRSVRLSAGVYLKNVTKLRWEEDLNPIPDSDKVELRKALVPLMLLLSAPSDKTIRAQVAESISLIAELDFPERWPNFIDQLTTSFSPTDTTTNASVLDTARCIFATSRALVHSDALFSEIMTLLL
ncbi:ARM repeat-containing protein [Athelia psychrophila]|uniref:ARM repeat-containing protein n=1 Tax=Athelia psychrophila TaxID=1759441 RepID=A0A166TVF3_9AGAM|nr:ARM repeat-containing protein [Fibularhizoctonia sp. CBS 109695]